MRGRCSEPPKIRKDIMLCKCSLTAFDRFTFDRKTLTNKNCTRGCLDHDIYQIKIQICSATTYINNSTLCTEVQSLVEPRMWVAFRSSLSVTHAPGPTTVHVNRQEQNKKS